MTSLCLSKISITKIVKITKLVIEHLVYYMMFPSPSILLIVRF